MKLNSNSLAPSGKRIVAAILDRIIIMIIANYVFGPVVKLAQRPSLTLILVNIALDFVYSGYFCSTRLTAPGENFPNIRGCMVVGIGMKAFSCTIVAITSIFQCNSARFINENTWSQAKPFSPFFLQNSLFKNKLELLTLESSPVPRWIRISPFSLFV